MFVGVFSRRKKSKTAKASEPQRITIVPPKVEETWVDEVEKFYRSGQKKWEAWTSLKGKYPRVSYYEFSSLWAKFRRTLEKGVD